MRIDNPPSALGPGREFDRIRGIWRRLATRDGLGDDCAVIEMDGKQLALSIDLSVQDVHFRMGWLTLLETGWRAAAAALSDLAAMAATPRGILVSLGVPPDWPDEHAAELMEGAAQAATAVGASVWGGDLVRSDKLIIDVAVVGDFAAAPVRRRGATAGDGLWVTGLLGGPRAALDAWNRGAEPEASARDRFAHPLPRVAEAAWLRDKGARAMIDLSDGLWADAQHISAASSVRCSIDLERVPRHPAVSDPLEALRSGEEYEVLVALPAGFAGDSEFRHRFQLPLTLVGTVEEGAGVTVRKDGKVIEVTGGFSHF
jgi:thiamine-monophosphate kinase